MCKNKNNCGRKSFYVVRIVKDHTKKIAEKPYKHCMVSGTAVSICMDKIGCSGEKGSGSKDQ